MPTRLYSLLRSIFLIILLIGVTISSHATHRACENLFKVNGIETTDSLQIIKDAFLDRIIFRTAGCAGNVGRLLMRLESTQDISQLKVVFLLHEKGFASGIPMKLKLKPRNVRDNIDIWNYHTIIFAKNAVIDLHSKPFPVPTKDYFSLHFPEDVGKNRWKNLMLRVFPADQYLNLFLDLQGKGSLRVDQDIALAYLNKPSSVESPLISVSDFILQQESRRP